MHGELYKAITNKPSGKHMMSTQCEFASKVKWALQLEGGCYGREKKK